MKKLLLVSLLFIASTVMAQTEPTTLSWSYGPKTDNVFAQYVGETATRNVDSMAMHLNRFIVTPGQKRITEFSAQVALDGALDTSKLTFVVVEKKSTTDYRLTTSQVLLNGSGTGASREITYSGLDIPVTLNEGATYYYGLVWDVLSTHGNNQPGMREMQGNRFPNNTTTESNSIQWHFAGFTLPSPSWSETIDGTVVLHCTGRKASILSMKIKYDSSSHIEYDSALSGAAFYNGSSSKTLIIPICLSSPTFVKLYNYNLVDGQNQTISFGNSAANSSGYSFTSTMTIDWGGTDRIFYGSTAAVLTMPNYDSYTQAGSTFDFCINLTSNNTKSRMFWLNKTKGGGPIVNQATYNNLATISFGARMSGAYNYDFTNAISPFVHVTTAGPGSYIERIQVGARPIILMGDSQTGTKSSSTTYATTNLLGTYLPGAFTNPRIYWLAGISGGKAAAETPSYHNSMMTRFSSIPGTNDLVDMRGVVYTYMGMGVNDTSAPATEQVKTATVMNILAAVSTMTSVAKSYLNDFYFVGLPPYTGGSALAQQAQLDINNGLAGLSMAAGVPYANPFHYALPYTDGSLHYTNAGAALIAPIIARTLENDKAYRVESLVGQTKRYNFNGSAEGQSYRFLP